MSNIQITNLTKSNFFQSKVTHIRNVPIDSFMKALEVQYIIPSLASNHHNNMLHMGLQKLSYFHTSNSDVLKSVITVLLHKSRRCQ